MIKKIKLTQLPGEIFNCCDTKAPTKQNLALKKTFLVARNLSQNYIKVT